MIVGNFQDQVNKSCAVSALFVEMFTVGASSNPLRSPATLSYHAMGEAQAL